MALIIDFSQLAVAAFVKAPVKSSELTKDLVKHVIINSLRTNVLKFKHDGYGEVILACDAKLNWRRKVFEHYKAKRRQSRESADSFINWDALFEALGELKEELRENFPYKLLEVTGAEGDDIVAAIVKNTPGPHLIIGSDKDYGQLHSIDGVEQFCLKTKKLIKIENPKHHLEELIICGDTSDGIPNIKSDDDTFVNENKRQAPISKAKLAGWVNMKPELYCENVQMFKNYERNQRLIDFDYIPSEVINDILAEHAKPVLGSKQKIMTYFAQHKMRNLLSCVGDF